MTMPSGSGVLLTPSIEKLENSGGEKNIFFSLLHIFFKNYRVLTRKSLAAHLTALSLLVLCVSVIKKLALPDEVL